jgi:regulator of replication initiation timing
MKAMMLAGKENELRDMVVDVDRQIAETTTQVQELGSASDEVEQSKSELLAEVTQLRDFLKGYRDICSKAQSKVHSERTGQSIENVRMATGGRVLVGIINPDGEETTVNQNIKDITAESGGRGIVGIARNVNIADFLGNKK